MPLRSCVILAVAILASLACFSVASKNRYANLFAEAMSIVEREALHPYKKEDLFTTAMNGMMKKIDEHSVFYFGDDFHEMESDMRQEFGGLGIFVEYNPDSKRVLVLSPMPGSPAFRAGLQIGDEICKVDGVDVTGQTRDEVTSKLRGPLKSVVKLTLQRGDKILDREITRSTIEMNSVFGDLMLKDGGWNYHLEEYPKIGYVRLRMFGDKTADELKKVLTELPPDMIGLIVDLRGNSGGKLDSAISICNYFLPREKPVVGTRGRDGITHWDQTKESPIVPADLPVVLLIDRFSASASEIVAGCLQDHGRAIIVGEQSFGKATVQNLIPMERGRSALKLTTASYWRPSGKSIDRKDAKNIAAKKWGIQPDAGFEITLTEKDVLRQLLSRNIRDLEGLIGPENQELFDAIKRTRIKLAGGLNGDSDDQTPSPEELNSVETENPDEELDTDTVDETLKKAIEFLKNRKVTKSPKKAA